MKRFGWGLPLAIGLAGVLCFSWTVWAREAPNSAAPWPVFRGTPDQKAATKAQLPEKLEVLWSLPLGDGVEATPIHDGKTAYIGTMDGKFLAVDIASGKPVWTQKTGPIKASACLVGDLVVVGDADGKVTAFSKKDGTPLWNHDTMAEITGGPNTDGESILQGTHDNSLLCFDLKGQIRWKFALEGPFYGTPAIADGKTFAAGCDSTLHIIDIKTGKEIGSVMLNGQTGASAGLDGNLLYVGTMSKEVQAIQLKQPKAEWSYSPEVRPSEFRASPAIASGIVVVGARDKRIHAMEAATGKPLWSFLTGGWVDGSPVIASEKVISPSLDGTLYILDLKKGTLLQKIPLDGPLAGSPTLLGSKVLVASDRRDDRGGTLFCLGSK